MDLEFALLADHRDEAFCAKKQVVAGTYLADGRFVIGTNSCVIFVTHGGCHRLESAAGHDYQKCGSLHAEIDLLDRLSDEYIDSGVRPAEDMVVWIFGHYYACEHCARRLRESGFKELRIREVLED